jgi:hypothetical protein
MTEADTQWWTHTHMVGRGASDRGTDRKTDCLRQRQGDKVLSRLAASPTVILEAVGLDPIRTKWMAALGRQKSLGQAAGQSFPYARSATESPAQ